MGGRAAGKGTAQVKVVVKLLTSPKGRSWSCSSCECCRTDRAKMQQAGGGADMEVGRGAELDRSTLVFVSLRLNLRTAIDFKDLEIT